MQLVQIERNGFKLNLRMLFTVERNLLGKCIFKINELPYRDTQTYIWHRHFLFNGTPSDSLEIYAASTVRIVSIASSTLVGNVFAAPVINACNEPIEPMKASGNQLPMVGTGCQLSSGLAMRRESGRPCG